jgi:hypothetical protein
LVGKRVGKAPLGKPKAGWEDSIKVDVKGKAWGVVDWIDMA